VVGTLIPWKPTNAKRHFAKALAYPGDNEEGKGKYSRWSPRKRYEKKIFPYQQDRPSQGGFAKHLVKRRRGGGGGEEAQLY